MELDLELQALQSLWTLDAPGHRQVMQLWHDATHAACSSGELPNYGGKGSCVAIMESFSNSGLGKGRASFCMEIFWWKVICHGQDQHLRDLAWWIVNWAADFWDDPPVTSARGEVFLAVTLSSLNHVVDVFPSQI